MLEISCRRINVRSNFEYSRENIAKILALHPNPQVVTQLDFNFCYWVQSQELCDFVKQCTHLNELSVAHSTISNHDLAEILALNENISKLSFSIESPETFWLDKNGSELSSATFSLKSFSKSHFGKCGKTLGKIESLELYIGQYPVILGTVLR